MLLLSVSIWPIQDLNLEFEYYVLCTLDGVLTISAELAGLLASSDGSHQNILCADLVDNGLYDAP